MKFLCLTYLLVSSLLFVTFSSFSQERLPLKVEMLEDIPVLSWYKNYLLKAYSQLNYRLNFIEVSPGRGLIEAQKGNFDALTARISIIENQLPEFLRVPVVLAKGRLILYCQAELSCDHAVLNNMQNVIGVPTGKNMTTSFMENKEASIYQVLSGQKLIEMFDKKRLDYILTIEGEEFGHYVSPPKLAYNKLELQSFEAYHYIHKKHEMLITQLTQELQLAIAELGPIPKNLVH